MTAFLWPTRDQVISIHDASIARFGGASGLRDLGLLDSALARPFSSFGGVDVFPDDISRVCAMVHGLVANHPFVDGNKRVGAAVLGAVLRANGLRFKPRHDEFRDKMLGLAASSLTLESLTEWVRDQVE